jgi:chemotaxis protein MotB
MKLHLALATGIVFLAFGCVPKTQYDEAMAANRRMNLELEKNRSELRMLLAERDDLHLKLKNADGLVKNKDADIKILEAAKSDLRTRFDELAARYAELLKGPKPAELGVINVALPEQVDKALQEFAKANPDLVEYLANYGMVKLKADLTFELGSDVVQASAQQALTKFAEILQTDAAGKFNVFIAGHTDDLPVSRLETKRRHPDNWYLSVHRAVAVQQTLASAGIAPQRICAMGFGEYHPIEANKPDKKGNKANRRVEIWIVSPERFLTAPTAKAEPQE